jgi:hypothetical protein
MRLLLLDGNPFSLAGIITGGATSSVITNISSLYACIQSKVGLLPFSHVRFSLREKTSGDEIE